MANGSLCTGDLASKLSIVQAPGSFCSPVSIHLALALVGAGSAGDTLLELQRVLGWPTHANWQQELASFFHGLHAAISAGEPMLAVANRVYSKVPVKQQYVQAIQSTFKATIEPLQSAAQVNGFVSETTRGMIPSIVTESIVSNSQLIAVNAVYFKGKWAVKFDEQETRIAEFASPSYPSTCHMMKTPPTSWFYHEDASAEYILLPYADGAGRDSSLAALVALPRSGAGNAPLAQDFDWRGVLAALQRGQKRKGTLFMPRFKVETEALLGDAMKAIGVCRAFDDAAEFPMVSDVPLKIDEIIHKVKVEVDEAGTVAAAATAVVACFGAAPRAEPPPFQMRCDRPFAFSIVALQPTPLVLFAGTVIEPGLVGSAPAGGLGPGAASPFSLPRPPASKPPCQLPSQMTLQQRTEQACLFTPACRRDVYRVLCSPPRGPLKAEHRGPAPAPGGSFGMPAAPGSFSFGGRPATATPFGASPTPPPPPPHPPLRWVLGVHSSLTPLEEVAPGGRAAAVTATLESLEQVGQPTERGLAITGAFEKLLVEEYVGWWSDSDAATLSVAFTLAFGQELSPRLDIEHAIRSRELSERDIDWLRGLPAHVPLNRALLAVFQGAPS